MKPVTPLRTAFQLVILLAAAAVGLRHALGWSRVTVETYCPFGGLEALLALMADGRYPCVTGERNLALFLALLALTVLARRAFCGWICPVGAISEWIYLLATKIRARWAWWPLWLPQGRLDRALRLLRLAMLLLILGGTFWAGELIFRGFDPYYILFSFHGHEVKAWSYLVLTVILAGVVVVPMAWCRYLCPLGGALWPLARVAGLRFVRQEPACRGCGACDRACPQGIVVSTGEDIRSGECTLCFRCHQACPAEGALSLTLWGKGAWTRRPWAIPSLAILLAAGGVGLAGQLAFPSFIRDYGPPPSPGEIKRVELTVAGVRCVETAAMAASTLDDKRGLVRLVAYASQGRIDITYDVSQIDVAAIQRALEGPVFDRDQGRFLFRLFRVLAIDGGRLSR